MNLRRRLASIRLYLETLKTRKPDETQRENFYDIMLADSDRLLHTVEQVLQAGQASHKRRRLSPTIIDLGDMVRECLEVTRVQYHLAPESLRLDESMNGDRARVAGDAHELRAAVSNLLDNAIKYSDKEVRVSVEVAILDEKRVAVRIADDGIGIPRAQLKRIFKRFYRAPGLSWRA